MSEIKQGTLICYIYYSVSKNDYLLSQKDETESKSIDVVIDKTCKMETIYYAKLHFLEGYDSVAYASNNKKKVCEFIYNYLELGVEDDIVYYISGDVYKCKVGCCMKSKQNVINCMMLHGSDEYEILELNS